MDIVYGLGRVVVMYMHGCGILASCCIYLVLMLWICISILALFYLSWADIVLDGKIKFFASMPPNFSIIHWALLGYY